MPASNAGEPLSELRLKSKVNVCHPTTVNSVANFSTTLLAPTDFSCSRTFLPASGA